MLGSMSPICIPGENPAAMVNENRGDGGDRCNSAKGSWIRDDDRILLDCVEEYSPKNWNNLRVVGLLNRKKKVCSFRYMEQFKPGRLRNRGLSSREERYRTSTQASVWKQLSQNCYLLHEKDGKQSSKFWNLHQKQPLARKRISAAEGIRTGTGSHRPRSPRQICIEYSVRNKAPVMQTCGTDNAIQGSFSPPPQPDYMDHDIQPTEEIHFYRSPAGQLFQKKLADDYNRDRSVPDIVVNSSPDLTGSLTKTEEIHYKRSPDGNLLKKQPFDKYNRDRRVPNVKSSSIVRCQFPLRNVSLNSGVDCSHREEATADLLQGSYLTSMFEIPSNLPSPTQYLSPPGIEDPFADEGYDQVNSYQVDGGLSSPDLSHAANASLTVDLGSCFNLKNLIVDSAKQHHMLHKFAAITLSTPAAVGAVANQGQYFGYQQPVHGYQQPFPSLGHVLFPVATNEWVDYFGVHGESSAPISPPQFDALEAPWGG